MIKHQNKLLKQTKLSIEELEELQDLITKNIIHLYTKVYFLKKTIIAAEKLLIDVDLNDTVFVALTKNLKAKLWTGDKELIKGLKSK